MQQSNAGVLDALQQALSGTAEAFGSLSRFATQTGEHLRSGEIREGNELLVRILQDFSFLSGFFADVGRLPEFRDGLGSERLGSLEHEYLKMTGLLRNALEAQQTEDWVYLADLLEYELAPVMNSWDSMFRGFCPLIVARAG